MIYPPAGSAVEVRDSSFLFGSAGTGDARVTINGRAVRVWPNGAWLAWLPFPPDSVMHFLVDARTDTDSAALDLEVRRAHGERLVCQPGQGEVCRVPGALWVDSLSLSPSGRLWWPRDEYVTLAARASEGARLQVRLADGTVIPLVARSQAHEVPAAIRAFDRDPANLPNGVEADRYQGVLRGRATGPDPGPVLAPGMPPVALAVLSTTLTVAPAPDSSLAVLEAIRDGDTVRVRWPLQIALLDSLPVVAELDDDTAGTGTTDSLTVGRANPGGSYHWFFPTGTRVRVSGRANDDLRIRLSPEAQAWIPAADAQPLPPGVPAPRGVVGSLSLTSAADRVTLRLPLGQRIPFQVLQSEHSLDLKLYSAVGGVDWIRYLATDRLVEKIRWVQTADNETTISVALSRPVWGYRTRWERGDLLLEVRRPPPIDPANPLRDRLIAVDPGHPPAGATGPTGLREAEANLGVALELRRLLETAGSRVLMTRTSDTAIDLYPRVALAEREGAELLVSVHNNALPDGVNPLTNNGTSVYYNQPQSVLLAREVQAALVRRLGLRDLGIGLGDLALVRGTWMPSVLTEGLFMIMPDQEAALRTIEGRRQYAAGIVEGIRRFLGERAR
ncbi:MAG: N-acetylmuramoyl-L-alanine amidase family protein, partial [Gemmatimonadales bacterium]